MSLFHRNMMQTGKPPCCPSKKCGKRMELKEDIFQCVCGKSITIPTEYRSKWVDQTAD